MSIHILYYREIKWLVEIPQTTLVELNKTNCKLSIRLDVPPGMYVNPDEIADTMRNSGVSVHSFQTQKRLRVN